MLVDGALSWLDSAVVVVVVLKDKFGSGDVTAGVSYSRIVDSTYVTCKRTASLSPQLDHSLGFSSLTTSASASKNKMLTRIVCRRET